MLISLLKYSFVDKYFPLIIAISIISVIIYIVTRVFCWVMFKKSNVSPILSVIPILNYMKLIEIAELPKTTIILLFIPIANIVAICRIKYEVSIRFGKDVWFSLLYVVFPALALYLLLPSYVVYKKESVIEEEKPLPEVDLLKDFKPEIKSGAVPFEETAKPHFEENKLDLDVELKTIELGSSDSEKGPEKGLVTVSSGDTYTEQAQKVVVDLSSNSENNAIKG